MIKVTLVRTKETLNCIVFDEVPASADAKPTLRSPLYLPKTTPGILDAVAVEVTVSITASAPAAPAPNEQPGQAPATPAKGKRETAATSGK